MKRNFVKPLNCPLFLIKGLSIGRFPFKHCIKAKRKLDFPVPYEPIKQKECIPAVNESTILPMVCLALAVTM